MASEVVQLSIVLVRAEDEWRAHLAEDLRTSAAGATQGEALVELALRLFANEQSQQPVVAVKGHSR